ncbi:response regulator transcription factor [Flavitalea sp. BT771]|uniref:response regulator transcription factor n=1 Tax=Flavitalea sp. BT771 TaxID=3063329 RepID=UPI0026E467D9|nr:response regulator transcription factor [Flavitalea sp. BT771]MDO6434654.1 response regulator transcription factor [Flavitalea sp. BT771]MDV6223554.1 response regulator transcription factor [Flavitalea sp. BT771]
MKLLIVEDEKALSDSISSYLEQESFVCDQAETYMGALAKIEQYDYDCILLDINLQDGNGLELLKELKSNHKGDGVLIISARNSLEDKVSGLKLGADDYLPKPFHLSELGARVAAIIRRRHSAGSNFIRLADILIDIQARAVMVDSRPLDLTRKEYQLLLYFAYNKGRVVSKNAIAEHLWGDDTGAMDNYDFIYTHIKNLRRKLVEAGAGDYIQSVYGMGYKLQVP